MQRAFGKSAYKTVFLLTILTMGIVFAVFTVPAVALNEPNLYPASGPVGEEPIVNGTGAAAFSVVSVYWESIDPDNLLATATADNTGFYET
ncbi:MAG: hypothetical protein JSV76_06325, partial [Candidatus Bathyarchaeota archaeon]